MKFHETKRGEQSYEKPQVICRKAGEACGRQAAKDAIAEQLAVVCDAFNSDRTDSHL